MANEVEITISARDRSGPGLAAARSKTQAFANSTKATLGKAGVEAGQALGEGIVRGADGKLRDARGRFTKGGQDLGGGIVDGIKDGTERGSRIVSGFADHTTATFSRMGVLINAGLTAGLVGAAASAGTVAGGITLALGGAITAVGAVSAAQSQRVRAEWSSAGQAIRDDLADVAAPMERSALRAATVTRSTFGRLRPFLADFFKSSEPAVDRFVTSIGDGVASLGTALKPLQRGYSAVLDALSARSPAIFGALQRSLENLGETAEEHADDIAAAFEFAAGAVETTTEAIGFLADEWNAFTSDISAGKDAATDWGRSMAEHLYDAAEAIGINTEQMQKMRAEWAKADAAAAQSDGVEQASSAASALGGSARDATAGLRDLAAQMEELSGPALDAAEAQNRAEEAIDRATASVRENGRTLDVNTEKGRANRDALLAIARAGQKHIAAMQAENASTEAIAGKYARYRNQLIATAVAAGKTRAQAQRLADQWLATPESVTTKVRANISDMERKIATAKSRLKDPGLTRPERSRIRAEISDLQAKVRAAKAALASIRDRSVRVFVNTIYNGTPSSRAAILRKNTERHGGVVGGGRGDVRRFQTGGTVGGGLANSGSSLSLVGEEGPELVRLPFGSSVTAAGQTRAMMSRSGFGSISMAFRGGGQSSGVSGGGGMASMTREVVSFREALEKLSRTLFGQTRAVSAYEEAWDRAKASLKENGRRLSLTTARGRENRGALLDLAEAAREVIAAMQEQGRSSSTLIKRMAEQRREFVRMARSMGLSKSEAGAMADRLGLTTGAVRSALAESSGKASGGIAGGWTLVGERGPELARLPFGSSVVPAGQTAAMLAQGGAPAPVVIELRSSGSAVDDMLLQILRRAVRVRGGNVQLVLGRT